MRSSSLRGEMLESHIHLTLYPEHVQLVLLDFKGHPPLWRIQDEGSSPAE